MAGLSAFRQGDLVEHPNMGPGVVKCVVGYPRFPEVHVTYENGGSGKYDENWFACYPDLLSKRSPEAPDKTE